MDYRVNRNEKIWFLSPSVFVPTGGINNFYRLCSIAEEVGIKAKVISVNPYPYVEPKEYLKYWHHVPEVGFRYDMFNIPEIEEGDIVVQPEIYNWKPWFSKKVRRVTYIQNWALVDKNSWENHYWVYNNMTHLSYCVEAISKKEYPNENFKLSGKNMEIEETIDFINGKKIKWSTVSPYFEIPNNQSKEYEVLMFPRKSPEIVNKFREIFGDKLLIADNVSPEDAKNLISKSKIIVLPSASEGLCFPAIEAILSKTLVVTWNCGAPEDYIIDNFSGILCEYGNINQLVEKTLEICNNDNYIKLLTENAYNLIYNLYTRENSKRELLLSYFASLNIYPE